MNSAANIRFKTERALRLIDECGEQIETYFGMSPFRIRSEEVGDRKNYYFEIVTPPPITLAATIGDAIHDARTALDYLAHQLVIAGGGTPGRDTAFPIYKMKADFRSRYRTRMTGAAESTLAMVEAMEPYGGGNDGFLHLRDLDDVSKHRFLTPVFVNVMGVSPEITLPKPRGGLVTFRMPGIRPADRQIADGDLVLSHGRDALGGVLQVDKPQFRVALALENSVPLGGEELPTSLGDLVASIVSAIEPLIALLD